jgi:hypothetical protein
MNNRLWFNQTGFSNSFSTSNIPVGGYWGVLISSYSATSSTVTLEIDWFFEVREPQLSGVLLGTEAPSVRKRLELLVEKQCPWSAGKMQPVSRSSVGDPQGSADKTSNPLVAGSRGEVMQTDVPVQSLPPGGVERNTGGSGDDETPDWQAAVESLRTAVRVLAWAPVGAPQKALLGTLAGLLEQLK